MVVLRVPGETLLVPLPPLKPPLGVAVVPPTPALPLEPLLGLPITLVPVVVPAPAPELELLMPPTPVVLPVLLLDGVAADSLAPEPTTPLELPAP